MTNPRASISQRLIVVVAFAMVVGLTQLMLAQEAQRIGGPAPSQKKPARHSPGVPWDWTHHHVVFSHPGTAAKALRDGAYDRWLKITRDPRYIMQQLKRSGARLVLPEAPQHLAAEARLGPVPDSTGESDAAPEAAAPVTEEEFPGGVLPRGLARALRPPPMQQSEHLTESREAAARMPPRKKNRFHRDWSETEGNNGTTGLGVFPATFTSTAASCSTDFAVYNTGLAGSSTQASIIAFNNLYSPCNGGNPPTAYWAYNSGGTIVNSVVLSLDGTQVAFVQTENTTGHAGLVLLKWKASSGTLTVPVTPSPVAASSYNSCTAPCMTTIAFSGNPTDTYSSPFVAFGPGGNPTTIYSGDDAGMLHQFTNIFTTGSNTPGEVTTSPWPVTLNTSTDAALGSPVYDATSGKIFIGDYLANISSSCQPGVSTSAGQCGYLYSVNASSGAVVQSAQLDYNLGIYDSPIVDSTTGMVYAFVGADNSTNCSSGPCAAVFQFPANFSAGAPGAEATVGAGYEFLMSGSFDNQYFTSTTPASPSGHLYVVGGTGPQNNTLYAITFTNGVMSTAGTPGPVVATNYTNSYYAAGLQVTEFCNNGASDCTAATGTDYLFLGVLGFGSNFSSNPCTGQSLSNGCVMGFTAPTGGTVSSAATPNGVLSEAGGTSGIVVDNGAAGASNIYFSTLLNQSCTGGTGGCAVSATQAALH